MEENFNNKTDNKQGNNSTEQKTSDHKIRILSMDDKGKIHNTLNGAVITSSSKTFITLGWISAALAAFISPYFAIAGIAFGILAGREAKGSGKIVIIANIVLALINFVFRFFLFTVWRMIIGV